MANIIITGANEGIGYYMIKKLLADGNRVSVLDIETQNLEILKNKYNSNFIFYKVDLRNNEEVKMAVDKQLMSLVLLILLYIMHVNALLKVKLKQILIPIKMFLM